MFNYTLKGQGLDVVDTVLSNRGLTLEQANLIMKATFEDSNLNASDLKNIDKACEMLNNALKKCFKIGILIDSDCDGYCASATLYSYLTNEVGYSNVLYKFHDKPKAHGIKEYVVNWVKEEGIKLLIIPDAGCGLSDKEGEEVLSDLGVNIIILDHHIPEYVSRETTIIVNPHQNEDKYLNKYLSGTGVTHKFIEYHLGINNKSNSNKELYEDLVALSLVSDMMNLRDSLENRAYINLSARNIKSPFIYELLSDKKEVTIEDLGFVVAPLINATVRLGNEEEKNLIFNSLFREDTIPSNKRGMVGKPTSMSSEAIRIANNLRRKQNKERDRGVERVSNIIKEQGLDKNKVIIVIVDDDILDGSISGLVANRLVNEYNKPVMLLRMTEDSTLAGSTRTFNNNFKLKNFKSMCLETGLFEYCSGHEGSFGACITVENFKKANEVFNELLKDVESDNSYEIDGIYEGKIPQSDISSIIEFEKLWCFDIKEPLFLVKGIKINTNDIKKVGNATYTFNFNKTMFTKFYASKVWFSNFKLEDELPFGGDIEVELICRFRNTKGERKEMQIAEIVDAICKVNYEYDF